MLMGRRKVITVDSKGSTLPTQEDKEQWLDIRDPDLLEAEALADQFTLEATRRVCATD